MSPGASSHHPSNSGSFDHHLSPVKPSRDRSLSRSSSRNSLRSIRATSPSIALDDPVVVRTQMSTLKHSIRHQQAQLNSLETIVRSGPRPYPPELAEEMASTSTSPGPPSAFTPTNKAKRRSSYEVLHGIAGPDSSLPLPKRDPALDDNSIREGVPAHFGAGTSTPTHHKRPSSPTRTLSRIPISAVGNARALADEGQTTQLKLSPSHSGENAQPSPSDSTGLAPPPSPNRRISLTPGGTTKVLADLQTGVINARNALENTKAQLRLSQRTVAQLTRLSEDLKESRERLRLENEGLNNVVARKERLLQEILERARKAEAEAASLKTQLKSETTTSKKTIREMETQLSESTALSQKSEREYITLRDSIKGLVEGFKSDTARLREEMKKREDKLKADADNIGAKYRKLLEDVKEGRKAEEELKKAKAEDKAMESKVEQVWLDKISSLKEEVEQNSKQSDEAGNTAQALANELARLKRLIQNAGKLAALSQADDEAPP
ncbi:hypothetical protein BDN72DRAFT_817569 [Pluteus cervinus]|uniref:Uncharacterized protein n=1 Tax=Pluteus cervinus TaxID=181527 RepID=A0ACD3B0S6_9AGAR|nr:hypothetical protein BDN72DRAFT_817569 [Pluteus cervinus]